MDYLLKKFKENVSPILEPLGFKQRGRKFYIRITDEKIYQSLELCKRPPFYSYLRFMSVPLFLGRGIYLSSGDEAKGLWANSEKDAAKHDWNAADMAQVLRNDLIPFFEKTKTLEGAYQAEFEGYSMGRDYFLGMYQAKNGDCQAIINLAKLRIEQSKEAVQENVAFFRENGTMSEEEIQKYIRDRENEREDMKEKRDFFAESSLETIQKYFQSKEEETLRLSKWKFD